METSSTIKIITRGDRVVELTRVFDASPALVFDALTRPDLLRRWYAPAGWTLDLCEIDLTVGGGWRIISRKPNGKSVGQFGVFREIEHPTRIVRTEAWEDWDAGETLVTMVLAGENGRTKLTNTVLFPSREIRDEILKAGMESSASIIYDSLADLLAEMENESTNEFGK